MAWLRAATLGHLDAAMVRSLVVDGNDGIIATAGIVEGFVGAGATGRAIPIAAFSAMVAGGVTVGGAKYAEEATEREARQTLLERERRLIEMSPDQELAELAHAYEAKGLSPSLAQAVATELTAADALAAHADVKHRLALTDAEPTPIFAALCSGLAYALGAGVPLLAALLAPNSWREIVTVCRSVPLTGRNVRRSRPSGGQPCDADARSLRRDRGDGDPAEPGRRLGLRHLSGAAPVRAATPCQGVLLSRRQKRQRPAPANVATCTVCSAASTAMPKGSEATAHSGTSRTQPLVELALHVAR